MNKTMNRKPWKRLGLLALVCAASAVFTALARANAADEMKRLAELMGESADYHLLTDGNTLYLETSPQQIVDILKNSNQPILGVCLSDAVRQVRAGIAAAKASTSVTSRDYLKRARKAS